MRALAALVLAAGLVPAAGAAEELADAAAEELALGASTYKQFCSHCHGIDMVNPGTSSYDLRRWPTDQRESFEDAVLNGRGDMPAWGDVLLEGELAALWRYVATRGGTGPFPEEAGARDDAALDDPAALPPAALPTVAEGVLTACLARNGGAMSAKRHEGGVGLDYEVAAAVAAEMGLPLAVTWYEAEVEEDTTPARDTLALLSYGLCDVAPGFPLYAPLIGRYDGTRSGVPRWDDRPDNLTRNPSVALRPVVPTRPYMRMEIALAHRAEVEPGAIARVADLEGLRLGVEQGTLPGILTLRQGTEAMVRTAATHSPGPAFLWEMEKGAFDAALVTTGAYDHHLRQNAISTLRLHDWRHELGFNLGMATVEPAVAAAVDAGLAALEARGALPALAARAQVHYAPPALPHLQPEITLRDIVARR